MILLLQTYGLQSIFRNIMSIAFIDSCIDDKMKTRRKIQSIFASESDDMDVLYNEGIKIFLIDFDLKWMDDQCKYFMYYVSLFLFHIVSHVVCGHYVPNHIVFYYITTNDSFTMLLHRFLY